MAELTPRAREILQRALDAARRLNPDVVIRIVATPTGIAPTLAEAPEQGDSPAALGNVWVASGVDGVIDGGEHDSLVRREG